jgi:DNA-binding ferritin-like protein
MGGGGSFRHGKLLHTGHNRKSSNFYQMHSIVERIYNYIRGTVHMQGELKLALNPESQIEMLEMNNHSVFVESLRDSHITEP